MTDNRTDEQRADDFYERGICWCGRDQHYPQHDYYGIYAGKMCDQCFEEKYVQGPYDYAGAGESLDPDW